MKHEGLRPLPKEEARVQGLFHIDECFDLPPLSELKESYFVELRPVKIQKDTDFCGAFASCLVSEFQEGVELSPEWTFAATKKLFNEDPDSFGLDLQQVCHTHIKVGAVEKKDAPYSLENKDASFLRRIENWPDLYDKAAIHKKGSYWRIRATDSDDFDTLKRTLWKFKNEKCGVLFGVSWCWPLSQVKMETLCPNGGGHALAGIGWTPDGIYVQNSYGKEAGMNGRHFFSREIINASSDKYGMFCFHDLPAEQAKHLMENGAKYDDNWFIQLLKSLWRFVKDIL